MSPAWAASQDGEPSIQMDDQRSSVNFDSAVMWPFKLRGKHYLPTRGFSKSLFPPRRIAAMTCLMWFRDDLRLHDN
ncbi:hypothetical protein [Corynebacterium marquesiae]|uniref:hypothetical protein n=1 Tax=Corynebacterium marquesiae TaxID=2913503 RepID=UPI0032EC8DF7